MSLKAKKAELKLTLESFAGLKKDAERANENLGSTVKLVNQTKQCRNENCDKEFGASLETFANGYVKGLRCKRCKCRHSIAQS